MKNLEKKLNIFLIVIFWVTVALFILIANTLLNPIFRPILNTYYIFTVGGILFLCGIAIIVITIKAKIKGLLKKFFLLTGAAVSGFFASIILHNLVYGMFIYFFGQNFWDRIGGEEPFFFMIGLIVCPVAFLVGMVGSIIMLIETRALKS
ncbi:MAG: hypothetical protein ACQEP2_09440 [Actinomycetota bacterium]